MGKKAEQVALPGMVSERCEVVHRAAQRYKDIQEERLAALAREIKAKDRLLELMKENKMTVYRRDTVFVEVGHKDTIKVRIGEQAIEAAEGDD